MTDLPIIPDVEELADVAESVLLPEIEKLRKQLDKQTRRYNDASRRADDYRKERDAWKLAAAAEAEIGKQWSDKCAELAEARKQLVSVKAALSEGIWMDRVQNALAILQDDSDRAKLKALKDEFNAAIDSTLSDDKQS